MKALVYAVTAALLAAGCAGYGGAGLRAGVDREADVLRVMGPPAERYADPAGGAILAYPHGPAGYYTYMVSLDANGVVRGVRQALDERGFADVQRGLDRDAVRRAIGPPWRVVPFERRNETVWDYRFKDAWNYPAQFHVVFDAQGKVKETMAIREFYGHDPKSH